MRNDLVLAQIRDVEAAVGHMFDKGIEVVSIHIGPVNLPPVIRVKACDWTDSLRAKAEPCVIFGEMRVQMVHYELSWAEPADGNASPMARVDDARPSIVGLM